LVVGIVVVGSLVGFAGAEVLAGAFEQLGKMIRDSVNKEATSINIRENLDLFCCAFNIPA
jgi:hypothetical protein